MFSTLFIKLFVEPSQRTRTRPQATWVHVGERANTRIRESGGTLLYGRSNRFVAHFNAFTRIAIISNLVPWLLYLCVLALFLFEILLYATAVSCAC